MALTPTVALQLAQLTNDISLWRLAYTVDGGADTEALAVQVIRAVGTATANRLPFGSFVLAWINGAASALTDYAGGAAAPNNAAWPLLDQVNQTLRFANGDGVMHGAGNVDPSIAGEAILFVRFEGD